ncbi:hypothetical protein FZI93_02440 [Mycobacterium sp. CBMA361]|nr:hypothetical protein [Mycolicibacterium sp. CBMA 213]MUM30772.1 hypothetical protein [Mycolicibacterium sp. CBMA 361]
MRDRLLQLNSPTRPWSIRDGGPEDVDLVAEWKSDDPDWRQVLEDLAVALTFQTHLRLDTEQRLLHAVDHVVEWRPDPEAPGQWVECHDRGDLQLFWSGNSNCMHYLLTTDDIKIPIQQCAADAGWTYQAG